MPTILPHGTVFAGDYRVVSCLDAGGMGSVFLVDQLSTGRRRALKVMHEQLVEDDDLRKRFAQEARIGGQIESEHVVEVVGAGVDPRTGLPWIAMEHLEGRNLSQHVARGGALAPPEVLRIFQQLCHALGAAHRAGVVHRDIKPENIYLARSRRADETYTVKLLDLGVAKALHGLTHSGTLGLGTPLYMAPEQFKGTDVSAATDVWALGLLAFYLLTGRNYQLSALSSRVAVDALEREMRRGAQTRASVRAREIEAAVAVSDAFDWWFERCLAREPRQRFPNATVAFEQLERALSCSAPPPAQAEVAHDLGAQARRPNPTSVLFVLVLIVVVVVGALVFFAVAIVLAAEVLGIVPAMRALDPVAALRFHHEVAPTAYLSEAIRAADHGEVLLH